MESFDDRKRQFEAKFGRDQELRFKVTARRNRLLGEWAARQLDYSGEQAAAYAREVVEADFEKPGDADVLHKVLADLTAKGVDIDERRLRRRMDELMETAKQQVISE